MRGSLGPEVREDPRWSHCLPLFCWYYCYYNYYKIELKSVTWGRERSGREDAKTLLDCSCVMRFLKIFSLWKISNIMEIEKYNELPFADHSASTIVSILLFWSHLSNRPPPLFFPRIFWRKPQRGCCTRRWWWDFERSLFLTHLDFLVCIQRFVFFVWL